MRLRQYQESSMTDNDLGELNGKSLIERLEQVESSWITNPQSNLMKKGERLVGVSVVNVTEIGTQQTLTSGISHYEVDYVYTIANGQGVERRISREELLTRKSYSSGVIADMSKSYLERDLIPLEGEVLKIISQGTKRVPKLYEHDQQEIWMSTIKGNLLSDWVDRLCPDLLAVLKKIVSIKQEKVVVSEIADAMGGAVLDILGELERRMLIVFDRSGQTDYVSLAPRFAQCYSIEKGSGEDISLKETVELNEERKDLFRKGIKALLVVQKAGNRRIDRLREIGLKESTVDERTRKDYIRFRGLVTYLQNVQGDDSIEDRANRDAERIQEKFSDMNRKLYSVHPSLMCNFVQGDGYSRNMITRFGDVTLVDFFHAGIDLWPIDVVDFITYAHLFSSMQNPDNYYSEAVTLRSNIAQDLKEDATLFMRDYRSLLIPIQIKRALRAAATLSWILSGQGAYIEEHLRVKELLERRRKAYVNYLRDRIEESKRLRELLPYLRT